MPNGQCTTCGEWDIDDLHRCAPPKRPPFPADCTITNVRRGEGARAQYVYACLRGPDGGLLISATLDYINKQIVEAGTLPSNYEVTGAAPEHKEPKP